MYYKFYLYSWLLLKLHAAFDHNALRSQWVPYSDKLMTDNNLKTEQGLL